MKLIYSVLFILIFYSIYLYPQHARIEEFSSDETVFNDFSKPAFINSTQLDSLINNYMNTYHIPGLAALITTKEDGIIWESNYGYANVSLQEQVEDSTLFLIASISKTIVATAIMQFWEADSFDLDDNVNDYLDDFQVNIPNYLGDTVTIRMLMTHTSSIADNWSVLDGLTICGDSPIPLDTFLINYFTPGGTYYNASLNFLNVHPGTTFQYSNVAICILAILVEKFSGISFDQYCRENIFDPLEMNKTSWFLEGLDTTTIATPYLWQGGQYIPYCHYGSPDYADGNIRTNKMELENFLSTYMNWGRYNGETILDSSTIDLMLKDHLGYPIYEGGSQGLVWYQTGRLNGRLPWGHSGAWFGCATGMFFKPEEEWSLICFMNARPSAAAFFYLFNLLCDYAQDLTDIEDIGNPVSDYNLEQNYPNPFNPITNIEYQIPEMSSVTLKVYDVLGTEIETLVNEEKPFGTYELTWYADQLAKRSLFLSITSR